MIDLQQPRFLSIKAEKEDTAWNVKFFPYPKSTDSLKSF